MGTVTHRILQQILEADSFLLDYIRLNGQLLNTRGYQVYMPKSFYKFNIDSTFTRFIVINWDLLQKPNNSNIIKSYPTINLINLNFDNNNKNYYSFNNMIEIIYKMHQLFKRKTRELTKQQERILTQAIVIFNYHKLFFYVNIAKTNKIVLKTLGDPYIYADSFWMYNLT